MPKALSLGHCTVRRLPHISPLASPAFSRSLYQQPLWNVGAVWGAVHSIILPIHPAAVTHVRNWLQSGPFRPGGPELAIQQTCRNLRLEGKV